MNCWYSNLHTSRRCSELFIKIDGMGDKEEQCVREIMGLFMQVLLYCILWYLSSRRKMLMRGQCVERCE